MDIKVTVIPHAKQRYPTVGDWYYRDGVLYIKVSFMDDEQYESLVAVHEIVEALLCRNRGITEKIVTEFDFKFEEKRIKRLPGYEGEPGDHPQAPYRKEHFFATSIERLLAAELKVDWKEYDEAVNNL